MSSSDAVAVAGHQHIAPIVPMIIAASIVCLLFCLVYRWSVATLGHFDARNVQFTRPWPLVGNLGAMLAQRKTSLEIGVELYERFKHEA